jgi:soluble lytic murein transglycosylase-like protein
MIYSYIILPMAKFIGVPGTLLLAICTVESGGTNYVRAHDGPSSTFGVCQIKSETAKMLGFKGKESDLMKPKVNIEYAARYLRYQLDRYDGDICRATAAYNTGTYLPSDKVLGRPKNFGYVKKVAALLDDKRLLSCGKAVFK